MFATYIKILSYTENVYSHINRLEIDFKSSAE